MTEEVNRREPIVQTENKQECIVRFKDEDLRSRLAKVEIPRQLRNRVKLYVLCERQVWEDRGTGHVACVSFPERQEILFIVVRLEDAEKNLLESRILRDTVYQKQQET